MRMPSVSMDLLRGTKEEIVLAYMKGVTTIMRSQDIRDGIKKATGVDMNINTFDMIMSKLWRMGKIIREGKGRYRYKT